MGLPSCIKIVPTSFHEVSHSTIKTFMKFSVANSGARHIASLRCSKELVAFGVQENESFFGNIVRGVVFFP